MSGLVPEKRLDKNGRMVTRHVRQGPATATAKSKVPPRPTLSPGAPMDTAALKLRASQTAPQEVSVSWDGFGLRHSPELQNLRPGYYSSFKASDAEAYDVVSACGQLGDAALLLAVGVRSAGEARALLQSLSLDHLLSDEQSELAEAALSKCIHFDDFLSNWWIAAEERPVADRVGALKLATSPLRSVIGIKEVVKQVLEGVIDFEDIRSVGLGRLKEQHMIIHFAPLLEKAKVGKHFNSVQAIRALADRVIAEKPTPFEVENFAQVAILVGAQGAAALPDIRAASNAYRSMTISGSRRDRDARERITFFAQFFAAAGWETEAARQFYKACVPVETAIAVHASGGTVEQALAVQREGGAAPLAGGYL